jgi:hypothetical protein
MNEMNLVWPLITLIIGWLLGEAGHRRRELSNDRRAIAKALADLLEVRYQTIGFKAFMDGFAERFKIPKQQIPIVLNYIKEILPNTDNLQTRYNDAVDAIAAANPILGFRLRSRDEITKYISALRRLSATDPTASLAFQDIEAFVLDAAKAPMDEIILDLAREHGFRTHWKLKRRLSKPAYDPKDLEELFSRLEKLIAAASQSGFTTGGGS